MLFVVKFFTLILSNLVIKSSIISLHANAKGLARSTNGISSSSSSNGLNNNVGAGKNNRRGGGPNANKALLSKTALEPLTAPIVKLAKHLDSEAFVREIECVESIFMSPFREPVVFSANATIKDRIRPVCRWNFIGTEPCIPKLSCPYFNLEPPTPEGYCKKEAFVVFDGNFGFQRFCGNKGPRNLTAANDLRDLFISFESERNLERRRCDPILKFNCTMSCSDRANIKFTPLEKHFKPRYNSNCFCGMKSKTNKIVNGYDAPKGKWPWIVAFVEANTRQPFCGGSVLNDRMILTAGHCFLINYYKYLNIHNVEVILNGQLLDIMPNTLMATSRLIPKTYDQATLRKLDAQNGSIRVGVEEVFVHPLYVSETNDFDVAIVKLSSTLDFRTLKVVYPVCLPKLGSYMRTFANKNATVAGWGLPGEEAPGTVPNLQELPVNVFSPTECKKFYAHRVNRRMLCAGYKEGKQDSCLGDSGGPLVVEDRPKVYYQVGSVSWGEGCAVPNNPGVYIRTTESGQWLHYHSNVNDAVWCKVPGENISKQRALKRANNNYAKY